MDDFLKKKPDNDNILDDKKIEFKHFKEKRTTRTYIYNLEHYVTDPVHLEALLVKLKRSLGTGCIQKNTDFGMAYGLNGDCRKRIVRYLLNKKIVTEYAFKKIDLN
jgi:translation initiation factor 1 (eIF-1/SUI1)